MRIGITICAIFCMNVSVMAKPTIASEERIPASVSVCFTPGNHCQRRLVKLLDRAQKNIDVQGYSFTAYPIAKALMRAKRRGVSVRVILDGSQFQCGQYSLSWKLIKAGIPVWVDDTVSIAHNKVMLVDGRWVETGSYNFTRSAEDYNAENMLLLNSPKLNALYQANWNRRLSHARPVVSLRCHPKKNRMLLRKHKVVY